MSSGNSSTGGRHRLKTGRLCLELIATVRSRRGHTSHDKLTELPMLAEWLSAVGLRPGSPPEARDVAAVHALREAIYRLAVAITENGTPGDDDLSLVNRHARGGVPVTQLEPGSSPGPALIGRTTEPSMAQVLTVLARDAVELFAGPDIDRLRQCQASPCGSFYLDTSRGGARRWCSSATCGNRIRVAAHRNRHNN